MDEDLKKGFKSVGGFFSKLVERANKSMNSELAKSIRKKLLIWGGIGLGVGILFTILGMVLFITGGFGAVGSMPTGIPGGIIAGVILFMLGGILVTISATAIRAGLAVVIAGVTTSFIDVNNYCPSCKDKVDPDELYCNKCGANLRANKLCSCGTQNDLGDKYCKKCGKQL
jgi:hypothetical protein